MHQYLLAFCGNVLFVVERSDGSVVCTIALTQNDSQLAATFSTELLHQHGDSTLLDNFF